ncbi:MAG: host attachment protein [Acetobacteraceae bacterium]|nr:host attachment protein [Acetobacteraceae bacterium]
MSHRCRLLREIKAPSHREVYDGCILQREKPFMPQLRNLCFVIADGGHARFVRPAEDHGLHTFESLDSAAVHLHTRDLVSDRAGRSFESGSPTRHAFTARLDPHDQEKVRFARSVADRINQRSAAGVFTEPVLVAPPHVLTEIVDTLDTAASAKVPDHDLSPHLKEWVRPVHRAGAPAP